MDDRQLFKRLQKEGSKVDPIFCKELPEFLFEGDLKLFLVDVVF